MARDLDNGASQRSLPMPSRRIGAIAISGVALVVGLVGLTKLVENVDADQIVVIQSVTGDLDWYSSPGPKWQGLGKVTAYKKRETYDFKAKMRFNDGAHGVMSGSIQYELPTDPKQLRALHTRFGSQESVQSQLIEKIVDKSIYMTGPLMSSQESYAERRNDLISFVEDQVAYGVYRTRQKNVVTRDPLTGAEKTVTVVEIVMGKSGRPLRQEQAVLQPFGVKPFNFSISSLDYAKPVERQIDAQQQARGAVQTAIANARKAEQDALTATKNGEAMIATARAKQEAVKASAVTIAERQRDVAKLESEAAEFTKQRDILLGEGEGARRRLVMQADGALEQKLKALIRINEVWATATANYKGAWVPSVVMGQGTQGGNGATAMMDMLSVKAARDLSINMEATRQALPKK